MLDISTSSLMSTCELRKSSVDNGNESVTDGQDFLDTT